jgi:hypothetical protein
MRESEEGFGICSRSCDPDAGDCGQDIHCVTIELDEERDERGVPIKTGYCFSQSFIDAKKAKKRAATAPVESWIDVAEGRLEGELSLRAEGGGEKTYQVKGALLRSAGGGKTRTIVDTAGMRTLAVDDEKKTFAPRSIEALAGDTTVAKTGKRETLVGRACEVWRIEEGRTTWEACVMQGAAFVDPSLRAVPPWMRELAVRGALPLRVVELDARGNETPRLVAVRFDARSMDANLFVVPKTYRNLAGR